MTSVRPSSKPSVPSLLVFLGRHCAIGVSVGFLLIFLLIFGNALGLGDLLRHSEDSWIAVALLAGGFAVTFGSLSMGTAIFLLPRQQDEPPVGTRLRPKSDFDHFGLQAQPARAVVRPRKR